MKYQIKYHPKGKNHLYVKFKKFRKFHNFRHAFFISLLILFFFFIATGYSQEIDLHKVTDLHPETKHITFSPDGKYMATEEFCVNIYIFNNGKPNLTTIIPNFRKLLITTLVFSPDGKYFAIAYWNNTQKKGLVEIYSVSSGEFRLFKTLSDHNGVITSISFSTDGKYFATASKDKTIKIYSLSKKRFKLIKILSDDKRGVKTISFSPDGKYLISGYEGNTNSGKLNVYSVSGDKFELIKTISDLTYEVTSIGFSPDGKYLAVGTGEIDGIDGDGEAIIYSVLDGQFKPIIKLFKDFNVNSLSFSPDGRYLLLTTSSIILNFIRVYSVPRQFQFVGEMHFDREIFTINFSPDSKFLISVFGKDYTETFCTDKGIIKIFSVSDKKFKPIRTIYLKYDWRCLSTFLPNKYLVSPKNFCSCYRMKNIDSINIYSFLNGKFSLIKTITEHCITSASFSPDNKYLAIGLAHKVKVYSVSNGEFNFFKTVTAYKDIINSVYFSPDNKYFVIISNFKVANIYSVLGGEFKLIKTLSDHNDKITSVSFSPDGKYFAIASNYTVKIYSLADGKFNLIKTLEYYGEVTSVNFSPDGKYFATASKDYTVKIYSLADGSFKLIKSILNYQTSVFFSRDSKYLLCSSHKSLIIYEIENEN